MAYRPVAGQGPRSEQRDNGCSLVTAGKHNSIRAIARQLPVTTIDKRLRAVFSVGSAPRLYNEGPRPSVELKEFSCGIFVGQEGTEREKLKNLHC
jgi:hypothetical protein